MHEFWHLLGHSVLHTLEDTAKVVPFLFLTYLLMEFLEHKAGGAPERWLRGSGKVGPLLAVRSVCFRNADFRRRQPDFIPDV